MLNYYVYSTGSTYDYCHMTIIMCYSIVHRSQYYKSLFFISDAEAKEVSVFHGKFMSESYIYDKGQTYFMVLYKLVGP
jgi:hypothetical protein